MTTGSASAGKTLLPTRSPAEAVFFWAHLFSLLRATISGVLKIKRIYEPPQRSDGCRILVDRVWPRGVSKERAAMALWLKEIGPSTALRKWFGHDPARWPEFQKRYREELRDRPELTDQIKQLEKEHGVVTLVFSARDEERNQAVVIRDFLAKRSPKRGPKAAAKKAGA